MTVDHEKREVIVVTANGSKTVTKGNPCHILKVMVTCHIVKQTKSELHGVSNGSELFKRTKNE